MKLIIGAVLVQSEN